MTNPNESLEKTRKTLADDVLIRVKEYQTGRNIVLPKNYEASNALKSAWLMLQETVNRDKKPVLEVCSKDSIANALFSMVIQGLNPDKKQCYFVAYGAKLTLMRSYHGTIAVAKRVGGIVDVTSNVIYNDDEFEYSIDETTGKKKLVKHIQKLENIDFAKIKGAYAIVHTEKGSELEVMTFSQIKKAWEQGAAKGTSGAHLNFTDEMCCKTVESRACKSYINTSDDSDIYEEPEPIIIKDVEVQEEIAEKANTIEIGFEQQTEVVTEVKTEVATEEKAPY